MRISREVLGAAAMGTATAALIVIGGINLRGMVEPESTPGLPTPIITLPSDQASLRASATAIFAHPSTATPTPNLTATSVVETAKTAIAEYEATAAEEATAAFVIGLAKEALGTPRALIGTPEAGRLSKYSIPELRETAQALFRYTATPTPTVDYRALRERAAAQATTVVNAAKATANPR